MTGMDLTTCAQLQVTFGKGWVGNCGFGRLAHTRFLKPEHFMKSIQGLWGWIWRSVGKARFSMIGWRVVSLTAFFAEVCRLKYALVTLWMLLVGPAWYCLGDGIWQDL